MPKKSLFGLFVMLFFMACGTQEGEFESDDGKFAFIESCALRPFKDGGWLLGIVPGMMGDSMKHEIIQLPPFFQSANVQIDTLKLDCEDILYTHLQVKIDRNRLQHFSTIIICYDVEVFRKIPEYLSEKLNVLTSHKVQFSPYMVWTMMKDRNRWLVELRDMRTVMDTLAYEYVVRNAGSY